MRARASKLCVNRALCWMLTSSAWSDVDRNESSPSSRTPPLPCPLNTHNTTQQVWCSKTAVWQQVRQKTYILCYVSVFVPVCIEHLVKISNRNIKLARIQLEKYERIHNVNPPGFNKTLRWVESQTQFPVKTTFHSATTTMVNNFFLFGKNYLRHH